MKMPPRTQGQRKGNVMHDASNKALVEPQVLNNRGNNHREPMDMRDKVEIIETKVKRVMWH